MLRKQVDTSGKSGHFFTIPQSCSARRPATGASVAIAAQNPHPTIEIAPPRRGDRLRVAKPRACRARGLRNPDMNTAPDLVTPTMIAATDPAKAAAAPRIRLSSHGFSIDHPDPELGEQLMAYALGSPTAKRCMALSDNW
jgi:hypothetical protein